MFSLLLSDKQLMSPNWLAIAEDPRPDQLPTPVSAPFLPLLFSLGLCDLVAEFNLVPHLCSLILLIAISWTHFFFAPDRALILIFQGNTTRNTYVGVLTNKRAMLCRQPINAPLLNNFLVLKPTLSFFCALSRGLLPRSYVMNRSALSLACPQSALANSSS
jgi:hypothetical protein